MVISLLFFENFVVVLIGIQEDLNYVVSLPHNRFPQSRSAWKCCKFCLGEQGSFLQKTGS